MTTSEAARKKAIAAVEAVLIRYKLLAEKHPKGSELFDYDCMNKVELLDADPRGSVVFRFKVTDRYANLNDVMHGGAYAVLFDMFTTTALAPKAKPGYWDFMGGVTRTLSTSYLKAVPIGTTVIIRSEAVQQGRTLALIRSRMESEDGQTIYATCEHHKVNVPTKKAHLAVRVAWDDEMEKEAEEEAKKKVNSTATAKSRL